MSKPDPKQIEFHATVGIHRDQIADAKFNIINAKQDAQAQELGLLIAHTKGWKTEPMNEMHVSSLDLYVFTKMELKDYVDACIKQKLIDFSERI
jgi:hypothetical protein